MSYSVGLDIGITSVGYAVLELDHSDEPKRIIKFGSRIFDVAENSKDGSSLAKPRRDARGARRRLRRHKHRLDRIKNLIVNENILTQSQLDCLYDGQLRDIYEIRFIALDESLSDEEFARVLIHIAQRRGFKSNRKSDANEKEAGKLLKAVKENEELLESKDYRTIGEMLYKDIKFSENKRNKSESYSNTFSRDLVLDEVQKIFAKQRNLDMSFASEEIEEKYTEILMSQRAFDEGPGGKSPYGGNQIEKMIGKCTFEKENGELRAPKSSYSFELFSLLQNVNNLRIVTYQNSRSLTNDERKLLIDLSHKVASLNYSRIRQELNLTEEERFGSINYGKKTIYEVEKKTKFEHLKSYHKIRIAFDKISKGYIKTCDKQRLNDIGYVLSVYKTDKNIKECLSERGATSEEIEAVLSLSGFSKFGHLSIKACNKLIPYLEEGKRYDEACTLAGYDFKRHKVFEKQKYLPIVIDEFDNITSPVVRRAVSQTIKVFNAIIREQGCSPTFVNIELSREMSKNYKEREKIKKEMNENKVVNDRIKERIEKEFNKINPTGMDFVKLKLWEEQGGICPYSLESIKVERLFEVGYVDVDHIMPYSISFDDGYKNKVLVKTRENRQKGNRLPLQYLEGKKKEDFIVWVTNNVRNYQKRQILLKENFTDSDLNGFKERNLQDTKYISKVMYNLINDYLEFAPTVTNKKKRVTAVNGVVTSYARKRWGIQKIREDGDLHHAVDAVVVACVTDGMINKISKYSKYQEIEYMQHDNGSEIINLRTGEVIDRFPLPWKDFRKELDIRLCNNPKQMLKEVPLSNYEGVNLDEINPCFVSRRPRRKVTGAAHKETIKSSKFVDEGYVILKRPLSDLKFDKNGELKNYYNPSSDTRLYNALKEQLEMFGGDAKMAFAKPFYKPTKSGKQGPLVKKVKLLEKSNLNVSVHKGNGVAENDRMVRVDVFFVEDEGYYFVPIYVPDTLKETLPNKACVANKPKDYWVEMSDENFIFSLYPNELLKVTGRRDMKLSLINSKSSLPKQLIVSEIMLYYSGLDSSTGAITAINHDNTYKIRSIGKTVKSIEKYHVDMLGNYYKVGKEKRQYFK
jgi:CRISPR-associated endonuclease Csn1